MQAAVLTIADSQNGSGAIATIMGSDPGIPTNTVLVQNFAQSNWQTAGSTAGDGVLSLSLPLGYYWGVVQSVESGNQVVSNLVKFSVTLNSQAEHYRILASVQAGIQQLILADLPPSQVYLQMVPDPANATFPGIFVTPEAGEKFQGGTNVRDDIGFPAMIYIADRNDKDYVQPLPKYLRWREQVIAFFRYQRLFNVPEVYTCAVEPNPVIDPKTPMYQYVVSSFLLRLTARVPRGIV